MWRNCRPTFLAGVWEVFSIVGSCDTALETSGCKIERVERGARAHEPSPPLGSAYLRGMLLLNGHQSLLSYTHRQPKMQLRNLSALFPFLNGLDLNGKLEIKVSSPRSRTFRQLQDFAAEMFNADPDIKTVYDGDSWTEEFMTYGCYCNKFVRGGGRVESNDIHENMCLGLYIIHFMQKL